MRLMMKGLLLLALVGLTAGPVLALPAAVTAGAHVSAPGVGPGASGFDVLGTLGGGGLVFAITIKKDIGSIATKFVQRAQAASGDYKTGVANAGGSWEQNTAQSEGAYDAGVQAAMQNKRFAKGVTGKGGKCQTNAVNLGAMRYGPGVQNAQAAYQAGMAPVLQALQSINLPAKSFRGSPANQARANAVSTALAAMRANK